MKKKNTSTFERVLGFIGGFLILSFLGVLVILMVTDTSDSTSSSHDIAEEEPLEEEPKSGEDTTITPAVSTVRNPLVTPVGNGEDNVTVMIYMNGSNLESDYGFATTDIAEMLSADLSDQVNVVIQTMGTREWWDYDIANDHAQRYHIENNDLALVDDSLTQLNCTDASTLANFIIWSENNYPADRYFLIFWNHGGGPVGGFGYDEWGNYSDSLTLDEIQTGIKTSGVSFDCIGMDCCIMSSIEICYALYDYCDYMILSEDFESSLGWSYEGWLNALAANTSISTEDLGTILIDDMVEENDYYGSTTLALIDQRYVPSLFSLWKNFAYANEESLLSTNFSREVVRSERALPSRETGRNASELEDYYITDMLACTASISSPLAKPLVAELTKAICYYNCTEDNLGLTGLSVTLPYGDKEYYNDLKPIFINCGIDKDYTAWLNCFIEADDETYYDYEEFDDSWEGWENFSY